MLGRPARIIAAAALAAAGILPAALASGPAAAATANTIACGHWRWPVKTGSDATRHQVHRTISYTTVAYLDPQARPASFADSAQHHRHQPAEYPPRQTPPTTLLAA